MTTTGTRRTGRRAEALSRERIVEAAVAILDAEGEAGLTFRALTRRLATGAGAIYWHVADKDELLGAAADDVVARLAPEVPDGTGPRATVHTIALGVFDAIDAHPWLGRQLSLHPSRPAMLQVFEGLGRPLEALGLAEGAEFACASALVNYVLGVAGQNAANARLVDGRVGDRTTFLDDTATAWAQLDAERYPFVRRMAAQLREHDDREQFLAGVDLILAGVEAAGER